MPDLQFPQASLEDEVAMLMAEVKAQKEMIQEQQAMIEELQPIGRQLQTGWVTQAELTAAVTALQNTDYSLGGALDSAWLCLCGALVMFMHAGFGMLETGSCRAKNASNVLMKNLVNVCVGTLGWWLFGWAFAYGAQNGHLDIYLIWKQVLLHISPTPIQA